MILEHTYFKVDMRDTFLSILKESSDISQLLAAWMGLIRWLTLAQENLVKYELQYQSPLQGETVEVPTSPISTDINIYEALEDVEDVDFHMKYIYENVPHHQDQVKSPESLRDGSPWSSILTLPENPQRMSQNRLLTIVEHSPKGLEPREELRKEKERRRIMDKFASLLSSPRVLNIGYGTPFKSSS